MKKYAYRTDENVIEKLKVIAESNRRSINQEIDYLVRREIVKFELENGEINVKQEHKQ